MSEWIMAATYLCGATLALIGLIAASEIIAELIGRWRR